MHALIRFRRALGIIAACSVVVAAASTVHADEYRGAPNQQHYDSRYNHNHSYPVRGYVVPQLPPTAYAAHYGSQPYYYHYGVWYRPYHNYYTVVAPPIGIVLPVLPPYYTTVWFGGIPYYYANDTYYVWSAPQHGYEVAAPPQHPDAAVTEPPVSDQLFIYPKNGQPEAQQATDRYECHAWARDQSGFDPTGAQGNVAADQVAAKRSQYQRAEEACLESRGYTVR